EACGLSNVYPTSRYPDARVDAYLFSPCGFSANGVVPAAPQGNAEDGKSSSIHYFTVHVTPEPNCSFASFETNVPGGQSGRTTSEIIEHVVDIFKPGRFSVTLFEAKGRAADPNVANEGKLPSTSSQRLLAPVPGYRRLDRIVHDFEDYDLVRKNFLFPDKQQGPHRSWKQEVKYLDDMFEGGSAYMVGKMNGDHWYLYITSPNESITPPRTPEENDGRVHIARIPASILRGADEPSDETLEILMTDLDEENAKQFYLDNASALASEQLAARAQKARDEARQSLGDLT
ncbi:hypothetical protein BN1723_018556, partial [Verticillium longisporum]